MRVALLALLALGCSHEVETGIDDADNSAEGYQLELDPWAPARPVCSPTHEQLARFEQNLSQRAIFPWTHIAGSYSVRGDASGQELVIFEEGRYEWRSWGCTGVRLETGTVDHSESWVVLEEPECRFGQEPLSPGVFLAGELRGRLVFADPDVIDADGESPDVLGDEAPSPSDEPFIPFPSIAGQPGWWYERQ